jgi:hypothetical protein
VETVFHLDFKTNGYGLLRFCLVRITGGIAIINAKPVKEIYGLKKFNLMPLVYPLGEGI